VHHGVEVVPPGLHDEIKQDLLAAIIMVYQSVRNTGPAGNAEFLVWLRLGADAPSPDVLNGWIRACVREGIPSVTE
jgi:hypothetical protein